MPNYTWLQLSSARTQLAARLGDPGMVKWVSPELTLYIQEALRMWNALTSTWKAEFQFTPSTNWNALGLLPGSPRLRTVTDSQCYTLMEYALTEPPTGSIWTGTSQFNIGQLAGALERRRNEIIQVANCNQQILIRPSTPNVRRSTLPDTTIEPQRVRFIGAPVFGPSLEQDQFNRTDPITSSFSGITQAPTTAMWGASVPGDVYSSFLVSQPDAKLFLTFFTTALGLIQSLDLSTIGSTVTAPAGTAWFMVSALGATVGQNYDLNFNIGTDTYTYFVGPNAGNFETDYTTAQDDTVSKCVPFGQAVPRTQFDFTATTQGQFFSLIFYDAARNVIQVNVVSNITFTAPTGTAFWSVTYNPNSSPDQSSSAAYSIATPSGSSQVPIVTLTRSDQVAEEAFEPDFPQETPNLPQEWMVASEPPLAFDVDIAPSVAGSYEVVALQSGVVFTPPTPNFLGIPDDYAWLARTGALADILGGESDATDLPRAQWCQKRYQDGLKLIKDAGWIYLANVNNVPVDVPGMTEEDGAWPEWDSDPSYWPTVVTAGMDLFWCPLGGDVGLTVIGNAPIPTLDTDFIQASRSVWDLCLSYAQFLAAFKMGGAEFQSALGLESLFITGAEQESGRLSKLGIYSDILNIRSLAEVRQQERW